MELGEYLEVCDECGKPGAVVEIGGAYSDSYVSNVDLCLECLKKAVEVLENAKEQQG